jgi:hypothetical protein
VCCSISGLWLHCGPLEYRPVIDPKSVADSQKLEGDLEECRVLSDSVDYSDEKTIAALKGAGVGAGVVGTGVAITLAAGGVVLLPVVAPIYALGMLIGSGSNAGATQKEESAMRAKVWNACLVERGYKVLSS